MIAGFFGPGNKNRFTISRLVDSTIIIESPYRAKTRIQKNQTRSEPVPTRGVRCLLPPRKTQWPPVPTVPENDRFYPRETSATRVREQSVETGRFASQ